MHPPEGLLGQMVEAFRRECLEVRQSERTTIHGADSMLTVLQLAMAEVNKQQTGGFMVALSDVVLAWKQLLFRKLNIPTSSVPLDDFHAIVEQYESFLKCSNTVDLLDIYSMYKKQRDTTLSLDATQLFEYLSGNSNVAEETSAPSTPCTPSTTPRMLSSKVKNAVRRVFCSYLSLLVNSKNDIAMALTLDVPKRSLGQNAFTSIKHAAREDNTSLFLAVTSFVRAIHLGGKGYAPAESNPLRKHIKGLTEYVQFMDNLEEILGEIPDPRVCCTRLVTAIRALLVKGRGSGDPVLVAADKIAKELKERFCRLHQNHLMRANDSQLGISPARPKAYAINHSTALGGRDTVKLILALLDEEALLPPSRNKADLLSEDQPILNGEDGICVLALYRSPEVSSGCSPVSLTNRVQSRIELLKPKVKDKVIRSQFACTYTDDLPLNRVLEFPSTSQVPTCIHPAPKSKWSPLDEENPSVAAVFSDNSASESADAESRHLQQQAALAPRTKNAQSRARPSNKTKPFMDVHVKAIKRKQMETDQPEGSENQPPKKKPATAVKNPVKAIHKTSNKKKLIVGQGKLTNFFRL